MNKGFSTLNVIVKDALDIGVYVDCAPDVIQKRWFARAASRGRRGEEAEKLFKDTSEKANEHVIPTKSNADIVISGEASIEKITNFFADVKELCTK